jgi:hypothetical protein
MVRVKEPKIVMKPLSLPAEEASFVVVHDQDQPKPEEPGDSKSSGS